LKELIEKVNGCDSSFANLVFLQTEEGLRDLQKKIKARESMDLAVGGFCRSFNSDLLLEPHEITPEESKAFEEFVDEYGHKVSKEFNNDYADHLLLKNLQAQDALKGKRDGSFRREERERFSSAEGR
jgi:hypothetical protein